MNDAKEIKKLLESYDDAYYNRDESLVEDAEYDALKARYLELTGLEEYDFVPGTAATPFTKVSHTHPVTSLAKVNTKEELIKALEPLMPVVVEPKFDGLTLVVYPGAIATRGNGAIGEDVTHTASMIPGMAELMKTGKTYRGEALMPISEFKRINEERETAGLAPFKNPRNAAAGMIRNKDAAKVQGLKYFAYDIIGDTQQELEKLSDLYDDALGVTEVTDFRLFLDIDEAVDYIMNFDRSEYDYELDGLVIKSNQEDSLAKFGSTGHHPKNAFAYKFPAEGQWTMLNEVRYQVGRSGKITPVAEFDPVDILGSTVSRATLHNNAIIDALDIQIGGKVFVVKANDVIPAIIKAEKNVNSIPVVAPRYCPECGSNLVQVNDQLFCKAVDCVVQTVGRIVHLAKREALDIEGLSEETAMKIVESGVKNPFDIFLFTREEIQSLPGFAEKSAKNLYENIRAATYTDLEKFIYAAGIPLIGRTASRLLAGTFGSFEALGDDILSGCPKTKTIDGFGATMVKSLIDYSHLLYELLEHVVPKIAPVKETKTPDKVLSIVITGSFMDGDRKVSRTEIEDIIKEAGHKPVGSVSKKTDLVIVGKDAGSKEQKAIDLGIKMVYSVNDLKALL